MPPSDPHGQISVSRVGAEPGEARAALVLLHGRGASAADILGLGRQLQDPAVAYLAPEAAGNTWYPFSFLAPREQNEPHLSSALRAVGRVVDRLQTQGVTAERVMIMGFSQGACLALEFAARNPRRYGGVVALTGGLIGPEVSPSDYPGSLEGTPAYLGAGDPDPHVPAERVLQSAEILQSMGAVVTTRVFPGIGHTVVPDEIHAARDMLHDLLGG